MIAESKRMVTIDGKDYTIHNCNECPFLACEDYPTYPHCSYPDSGVMFEYEPKLEWMNVPPGTCPLRKC